MLLFRSRKQPHKAMLRVPTVGPLTPVSHALIGLALAGAGYHLAVHALGLPQFRGPLRLALVIAGVVIVCTIFADGLDGPHETSDEADPDKPEPGPDSAHEHFEGPEKWQDRP